MKFLFVLLTFICIELPVFSQSPGYVYISGKKFMLDGKPFYPVGVNYWIHILYDPADGIITGFAPSHEYSVDNCYPCNLGQNPDLNCSPHPNSCRDAIKDDLELFHNYGMNAIMVGGFDVDVPDGSSELKFHAFENDQSGYGQYFPLAGNQPLLVGYISDFLSIVDEFNSATGADMKVILVASEPAVFKTTTLRLLFRDYLFALADELKTSTALMAYSMVHEAGSRVMDLRKDTVCNMVSYWYDAIKTKDNNHLVTLSVWGAGDVQGWDPAVLNVDFLDFHIYDEEPGVTLNDRIKNVSSGFYWVNQVATLPWIVGETGFDANWGNESDKAAYAEQTLVRVRDCGGAGYFWYPHKNKNPNGAGGIFRQDNTATPTAGEFLNFSPFTLTNTCVMPPNYYNPYNFSGNSVSGTVLDQNSNPVENAVVYGWEIDDNPPNEWRNSIQTFTKANGTFTLYSNNEINIIRISASSANIYTQWPAEQLPPFSPLPTTLPNNVALTFSNGYSLTLDNKTIYASQSENYNATTNIEFTNLTVEPGGNITATAGRQIHIGQNTHISSAVGSLAHFSIGNIPPDCSDNVFLRKGNTQDNASNESQSFTKYKDNVDSVIVLVPEKREEEKALANTKEDIDVYVFPNPGSGKYNMVFITGDKKVKAEIAVYGIMGNAILKTDGRSRDIISLDLTTGGKGIYFAIIKTETGLIEVRKIIYQ